MNDDRRRVVRLSFGDAVLFVIIAISIAHCARALMRIADALERHSPPPLEAKP